MSRIAVIGGTGYAGSAIVSEAAGRGHEVVALSRTAPAEPLPGETYVQGDATDEATLAELISGADVVLDALSPRGPIAEVFRDTCRTIARLADEAGVPLYVVGRFSSLRPAEGAPRIVEDLSRAPGSFREEVVTVSAVVSDDLPATPDTLAWVFPSWAGRFGSFAPGERLGQYRVGGDAALIPASGGAISGADYALGFVDLIEQGERRREHVNLAH